MPARFRPVRALLLVGLLVVAASAQEEHFQKQLEQKLSKPFVKNAAWVLDYDHALKQAQESKKYVFAYFTRSYAP